MKRLAWLLLAAAAFAAHAGDITVTKFEPGAPPPKKVLEHVALKGVITEFIDPERSELGKEIADLLWREVLTAISDHKGAGVILARAPGGEGWVAATAVRPRFSVPVVHFVAGLYRYQIGRWEDAAREFDQYLRAPGVAADNASYATACQLLGASRLASASRAESLPGASGWEDAFERAIRATPCDPAAYTLRAVSTIAVRRTLEPAVGDLKRALELDPQHADTRAALAQISAHASGTSSRLQPLKLAPASPALRRALEALAKRYAVPR